MKNLIKVIKDKINTTKLHIIIDSKKLSNNKKGYEWSEKYQNNFSCVLLSDESNFTTTLKIQKDDEIYVVWSEHSEGDSQGEAYCKGVEIHGAFKDKCSSEQLRDFIVQHSEDKYIEVTKQNIEEVRRNKANGKKLTTNDSQEFIYFTFPWDEYFDKFERVNVNKIKVL